MLKKLKIESEINNLRIVENTIDAITSDSGISKESYGKILIATLEAVNNAIVHGNKSQKTKFVNIEILVESNIMKVTVEDEGPGFKPGEVPDPTKPENIELLSGRGVFLMTRLADSIEFNNKGNCVKMTFKNIIS